MVFGFGDDPADPVMGIDIGSQTSSIAGIDPESKDSLHVIPGDDVSSSIIPTRLIQQDETPLLGHDSEEAFLDGEPAFEIVSPLKDSNSDDVTPGEDNFRQPRVAFFEKLFDHAVESVDNWDHRVALPYRLGMPDAGREALITELEEAGFSVTATVPSTVAAAIAYWQHIVYMDPDFDLNLINDGCLMLTVDIGRGFIETAVVSARQNTFKVLESTTGRLTSWPPLQLQKVLAEENGINGETSAENKTQYFGLRNPIEKHFIDIVVGESGETTFTAPTDTGQTEVTLTFEHVRDAMSPVMAQYDSAIERTLDDAGLDLPDIDVVAASGLPSRWRPLATYWTSRGAKISRLTPEQPSDSDEEWTTRLSIGYNPKLLGTIGASLLGNAEAGHRAEITVNY